MDERRTLFNSEVRPYSWPCVYVFVSNWVHQTHLSDPYDVVPQNLYLPDGRTVPTCVIEARKQHISKDIQITMDSRTPRNLLGPGSAIVNKDGQGMRRLATAGCIVKTADRYYVLTNQHVVGSPGTTISALQPHREQQIGITAHKGLTRKDFGAVYPNFASSNQHLLMDVGLVDLFDIMQWKTGVPGIEPVGPVLDLYDNSFRLKLINKKVVGQSAISGLIRGEIHGLFYRYKSIGGSEYITDFLIGPETYGDHVPKLKANEEAEKKNMNVALNVHHGDSGTLLFIEYTDKQEPEGSHKAKKENERGHKAKKYYQPFALLWGKEEFFEDGSVLSRPYAMATSLSTVLDHLDLDLVGGINEDQDYIWGWVGHYVIGRALSLPVDLVTSQKLKSFISKNIDLLSLQPDAALDNDPKVVTRGTPEPNFVPLADVPDNVWKSNVNFTVIEGKHTPGPGSRGRDDNQNHFADLDLIYKNGETFLDLNYNEPDTYLNPKAWKQYFAAMEPKYEEWAKLLKQRPKKREPKDGSKHWGALPFRVHQLFDTMVKAAKEKNENHFLCAGGVMIHYIGDACQPLHASYLSQGDPARVVKKPKAGGMELEAHGVHSGYEDDMIAYGLTNEHLAERLKGEIARLKEEPIAGVQTGYDAAKAVIALIRLTQKLIPPRTIVNKWVELNRSSSTHLTKKERAQAITKGMWKEFGDHTITAMARGTRHLAKIWQAAWDAGDGDHNIGAGSRAEERAIMELYNNPDFLPSVALSQYPDDVNTDWSDIKRPAPPPQQKRKPGLDSPSAPPQRSGRNRPRAISRIEKPSLAGSPHPPESQTR
jgi:hypothetical protein